MKYSVVIPLKNEEESLQDLIQEVEEAMTSLKAPWELICVDDGSTDQTLSLLTKLQSSKPYLRIVSFDKNYGQTSGFDAGFKAAKGEFVITLDGDGQNDPKDIPSLATLAKDADLVVGWRKKRQDNWIKVITSKVANFVRSRLCEDGVHDTGCSLKIYRKTSLEKIKLFHGMHRFLPALFLIEGFKVVETPVSHRPRLKGKTKYNFFNRSFNTIADLLAVRWMAQRALKYRIKSQNE